MDTEKDLQALALLEPAEIEKKAFDLYQITTVLIKRQAELYLDLGLVLKTIRDGKLYKKFGDGGFNTWRSFLADPDIHIQRVTADTYIRVYEYYVEQLKMAKEEVLRIPLNRLNMMTAKLRTMLPEKQDELIEKAKVLSDGDFKKELIESKLMNPPKIRVFHCDKCNKLKIEYRPSEMCNCDGTVHIDPMKDY